MSSNIKFPVFRKYHGKDTYFKIISESEFDELSFIGSKPFTYHIKAEQYPEFVRIQDMIACKDGAWEKITEGEFETKKSAE